MDSGGDRKVMAHKKPDVCKEHSCKLNKCLYETNYQMFRCQQHLDDMIDCCRKWGHQAFSCEGFMWMFKEEFPDKTGPGGGGEPKTGDNKPTTGDKPDDNKDHKK